MDIYLDHNSTSIIDQEALNLMLTAHQDFFGNPSSTHAIGRKAKAKYLNCKDIIAQFFKVTSSEVFFTRSATEAINWLLFHKPYKHIISSNLEHAAIYNSLKELEKRGTKVTWISPGLKGFVDIEDLKNAMTLETDLIFLGAANSETGILQKTTELSKEAKLRRVPIYIDAVGILGKAVFEIDPLVTAYIISSHKIHGPKGIAALIHKKPQDLNPLFYGGYQENGKIAGTESLPQIIGFSNVFKKLIENQDSIASIQAKRDLFEMKLKHHLDIKIIGENNERVSNTSCICFHGISGETLLQLLDHNHIYASHGSACSSGALEPSRVLINMGLSYSEAKQCLRFSFSKHNTEEDIITTVSTLLQIDAALKLSLS